VVFYQQEGCIVSEKATVCWKNTTVTDDTNFNVSVVYSQQVIVTSTAKRASLAASPYDIVYNSNNQLIGQIVSDVVSVDVGSNVVLTGSYQVCIPQNPNIPVEGTYTIKDFGYRAQTTGNFVALKTVITQSNGQWCADVTSSGYYVAALTTNTPIVPTGTASEGSMNFVASILIFLIVMFI